MSDWKDIAGGRERRWRDGDGSLHIERKMNDGCYSGTSTHPSPAAMKRMANVLGHIVTEAHTNDWKGWQ